MESYEKSFIPAVVLEHGNKSKPIIDTEPEVGIELCCGNVIAFGMEEGDSLPGGLVGISDAGATYDLAIKKRNGMEGYVDKYMGVQDHCFCFYPFDDERETSTTPVVYGDVVRIKYCPTGQLVAASQKTCRIPTKKKESFTTRRESTFTDRRRSHASMIVQQQEHALFQTTRTVEFELSLPTRPSEQPNDYTATEAMNPDSLHPFHPRFHFRILPAGSTKSRGQIVHNGEPFIIESLFAKMYWGVPVRTDNIFDSNNNITSTSVDSQITLMGLSLGSTGRICDRFRFYIRLFDSIGTSPLISTRLLKMSNCIMLYHKNNSAYLSFNKSHPTGLTDSNQRSKIINGILSFDPLVESQKLQSYGCGSLWAFEEEASSGSSISVEAFVEKYITRSPHSITLHNDLYTMWAFQKQAQNFSMSELTEEVKKQHPQSVLNDGVWKGIVVCPDSSVSGLPTKGGTISTKKVYRLRNFAAAAYISLKPDGKEMFMTCDLSDAGTLFRVINLVENSEDCVYPLSYVRICSVAYPLSNCVQQKHCLDSDDGKVVGGLKGFREALEVVVPDQGFVVDSTTVRSLVNGLTDYISEWQHEYPAQLESIRSAQRIICRLLIFSVDYEEPALQSSNWSPTASNIIKLYKAEGRPRSRRQRILFDFCIDVHLLLTLEVPFTNGVISIKDVADSLPDTYHYELHTTMNLSYKLLVSIIKSAPEFASRIDNSSSFMLRQAADGISPGPMLALMEMYRNNEDFIKVIPERIIAWVLTIIRNRLQHDIYSTELVMLVENIALLRTKGYYRTQILILNILIQRSYTEGQHVLTNDGDAVIKTVKGVVSYDVVLSNGKVVCDYHVSNITPREGDETDRRIIDDLLLPMKIIKTDDLTLLVRDDWVSLSNMCQNQSIFFSGVVAYYKSWLQVLASVCKDNTDSQKIMSTSIPSYGDLLKSTRITAISQVTITLRSVALELLLLLDTDEAFVPSTIRVWTRQDFICVRPQSSTKIINIRDLTLESAEALKAVSSFGMDCNDEESIKDIMAYLSVVTAGISELSEEDTSQLIRDVAAILDGRTDQFGGSQTFTTRFQLTERSKLLFSCKNSCLSLLNIVCEQFLNSKRSRLLGWFRDTYNEAISEGIAVSEIDWYLPADAWQHIVGTQQLENLGSGLDLSKLLDVLLDTSQYESSELQNKAMRLFFMVFAVPRAVSSSLLSTVLLPTDGEVEIFICLRNIVQKIEWTLIMSPEGTVPSEIFVLLQKIHSGECFGGILGSQDPEKNIILNITSNAVMLIDVLLRILCRVRSVQFDSLSQSDISIANGSFCLIRLLCESSLEGQRNIIEAAAGEEFLYFTKIDEITELALLFSSLCETEGHAEELVLVLPDIIKNFVSQLSRRRNTTCHVVLRALMKPCIKTSLRDKLIDQNVISISREMRQEWELCKPTIDISRCTDVKHLIKQIQSCDHDVVLWLRFVELTSVFAEHSEIETFTSLSDAHFIICGRRSFESKRKVIFPLDVQKTYLKALQSIILGRSEDGREKGSERISMVNPLLSNDILTSLIKTIKSGKNDQGYVDFMNEGVLPFIVLYYTIVYDKALASDVGINLATRWVSIFITDNTRNQIESFSRNVLNQLSLLIQRFQEIGLLIPSNDGISTHVKELLTKSSKTTMLDAFTAFRNCFIEQVQTTDGKHGHNSRLFFELSAVILQDNRKLLQLASCFCSASRGEMDDEVLLQTILLLEICLKSISKNEFKALQDRLNNSGVTVAAVVVFESTAIHERTHHAALQLLQALLLNGNIVVQNTIYEYLLSRTFPKLMFLIRDEFHRIGMVLSSVAVSAGKQSLKVYATNLLLFLQLLCEGHHSKLQKYLHTQVGKPFSLNVIKYVTMTLISWFEGQGLSPTEQDNIDLGCQGFRSLTEFCQGPSVSNQQCLHANGIVSITASVICNCDSTELVSCAVQMLLSLAEGAAASFSVRTLFKSLKPFFKSFLEKLSCTWIQTTISEELCLFEDRKHLRELAVNIFMLLSRLAHTQEVNFSQHREERSVTLAQLLQQNMSFNNLNNQVGCIEIKRIEGSDDWLEKLYFPIPERSVFLTPEVKMAFNESVQRRVTDSDEADEVAENAEKAGQDLKKIQDFFRKHYLLLLQTDAYYQASHSKYTRIFIFHRSKLAIMSLVVSFLLSLFLLISMTKKYSQKTFFLSPTRYNVFTALAVLQILVEIWLLFGWWVVDGSVAVQTHMHTKIREASENHRNVIQEGDRLRLYRVWCDESSMQFQKTDRRVYTLPWYTKTKLVTEILWRDKRLWITLLFAISAPLGLLLNPIFFSVQIFRIVSHNANLQNIVRAVTVKWYDIVITCGLGILFIYLFSMLSFFYFSNKYYDAKRNPDLGVGFRCHELSHCFAVNLVFGLRLDGGISDVALPPMPVENSYWYRLLWDTMFWLVMIVIFLNIIFGIILDTFKELRDKKTIRELDMATSCFICGKQASAFDKLKTHGSNRRGFETHYKDHHNQWMYLYFMHYLRIKDSTTDTGQEQYVRQRITHSKLDFFPDNSISLQLSDRLDDELLDELRDTRIEGKVDSCSTRQWCVRELSRQNERHSHLTKIINVALSQARSLSDQSNEFGFDKLENQLLEVTDVFKNIFQDVNVDE